MLEVKNELINDCLQERQIYKIGDMKTIQLYSVNQIT